MADRFSIGLAQLNPVLGDFPGNLFRARTARKKAHQAGADLILFSELFISGYPPEDLVLKPAFQDAAMATIHELAKDTADGGPAMLVGTPWRKDGAVYNAVALLDGGVVQATTFKTDLPNYGVFDEKRVFAAGPLPGPLNIRGRRIGVPICEDIWGPDTTECLAETGAEMLLVPNGSPFDARKRGSVIRLLEFRDVVRIQVQEARGSFPHRPGAGGRAQHLRVLRREPAVVRLHHLMDEDADEAHQRQ